MSLERGEERGLKLPGEAGKARTAEGRRAEGRRDVGRRLPPRPGHKRAASEDGQSARTSSKKDIPRTLLPTPSAPRLPPPSPTDDAESIIRQIINEREASFNSMRALCVLEEPASEEESQSDESPSPEKMCDIRRKMQALEVEQLERERSLSEKRRELKREVMKLMNKQEEGRFRSKPKPESSPSTCLTPSTDSCDTEKRAFDIVPSGKQIGKVIRRRPASLNVPKITNQRRIRTAIERYLESGPDPAATEALESSSRADLEENLVLVFSSAAKSEIEGLYAYNSEGEGMRRLMGTGPEVVRRESIQYCYHYEEEDEEFVLLTERKLTPHVDAVMLTRRRL